MRTDAAGEDGTVGGARRRARVRSRKWSLGPCSRLIWSSKVEGRGHCVRDEEERDPRPRRPSGRGNQKTAGRPSTTTGNGLAWSSRPSFRPARSAPGRCAGTAWVQRRRRRRGSGARRRPGRPASNEHAVGREQWLRPCSRKRSTSMRATNAAYAVCSLRAEETRTDRRRPRSKASERNDGLGLQITGVTS